MSNDIEDLLNEIAGKVDTIDAKEVLDRFNGVVEEIISQARYKIFMADGTQPVFLAATSEGFEKINIDLDETTTEQLAELMQKVCSNPDILVAALVIDAFVKSVPINKADDYKDKDLAIEPNCDQALFAFVYTRENTKVRMLPHKRREDSSFWSADYGWRTLDHNENKHERFSNPFATE